MTDRTIIAAASRIPRDRNAWFARLDAGLGGLWLLIAVGALIVMPPFFYLVSSSVTVPLPGFRSMVGLDNYRRGVQDNGGGFWGAPPPLPPRFSVLGVGRRLPPTRRFGANHVPSCQYPPLWAG